MIWLNEIFDEQPYEDAESNFPHVLVEVGLSDAEDHVATILVFWSYAVEANCFVRRERWRRECFIIESWDCGRNMSML